MLVIRFGGLSSGDPVDPAKPEAKHGSLLDKEQFRKLCNRAFSGPDLSGGKWWYLVFKPFEDAYDEYKDWFESKAFPEWCRDKFKTKSEPMIYTVEKDATRHHVNMLIYINRDLTNSHNDYWPGYCKLYCKPCYDYRDCVYYIFKEAQTRPFIEYHDYYISWKPTQTDDLPKHRPTLVQQAIERMRKALFD